MTAFAEKLKEAGADTLGAQLITVLTDGVRRHPDSVVDAWRHAGAIFGYELARKIMKDMGHMQGKEKKSPSTPLSSATQYIAPKSRVIPKERIEQRRKLQEIIRSKYRNSGGIPWSDVGWHELNGLKRDGKEAKALLAAGPANVPNVGKTVGEVLGVAHIDEIIAAVRKEA